MSKDAKRLLAARRLKATAKSNIEFIKNRIEVQKQPGFDRFATASGASMRVYNAIEIDIEQEKLDKAQAVINEYK